MSREVFDKPDNLCSVKHKVNTQPTQNGFRFNLNPYGKYTVKILHHKFDSLPTPFYRTRISRSKEIPLKIRFFIWSAALDRLLAAANLACKGIKV